MATEQKSIGSMAIPAIVVGVIGLAFIGFQTSQKNDQNNIDNLPAIVARLEGVERRLLSLDAIVQGMRDSTLSESALQSELNAIRTEVKELSGQVSRRFDEVVKEPLDRIRAALADIRSEKRKLREDHTDHVTDRVLHGFQQ